MALTMIGASVLGRICRNRTRGSTGPDRFAGGDELVFDRIGENLTAHQPRVLRPEDETDRDQGVAEPGPPRTAVIDMARMIDGNDRMASDVRMMTLSTAPPK